MSTYRQKTHSPSSKEGESYRSFADVVISTGNDIPGYQIVEHRGTVFGLTVRSRNALSVIGAGFKSFVGGEIGAMTTNMMRSREQAMDRMVGGARELGANAIYAVRFDAASMEGGWTEICCYGTAVVAVPL